MQMGMEEDLECSDGDGGGSDSDGSGGGQCVFSVI